LELKLKIEEKKNMKKIYILLAILSLFSPSIFANSSMCESLKGTWKGWIYVLGPMPPVPKEISVTINDVKKINPQTYLLVVDSSSAINSGECNQDDKTGITYIKFSGVTKSGAINMYSSHFDNSIAPTVITLINGDYGNEMIIPEDADGTSEINKM
jgi:hypothetical protein